MLLSVRYGEPRLSKALPITTIIKPGSLPSYSTEVLEPHIDEELGAEVYTQRKARRKRGVARRVRRVANISLFYNEIRARRRAPVKYDALQTT